MKTLLSRIKQIEKQAEAIKPPAPNNGEGAAFWAHFNSLTKAEQNQIARRYQAEYAEELEILKSSGTGAAEKIEELEIGIRVIEAFIFSEYGLSQ